MSKFEIEGIFIVKATSKILINKNFRNKKL